MVELEPGDTKLFRLLSFDGFLSSTDDDSFAGEDSDVMPLDESVRRGGGAFGDGDTGIDRLEDRTKAKSPIRATAQRRGRSVAGFLGTSETL